MSHPSSPQVSPSFTPQRSPQMRASIIKPNEGIMVGQMRELAKLPENARCADCDAKDPDWTSINLGIFVCIKCAGIHRQMGVHLSKVRSIELDTSVWDDDMISYMRAHGNEKARHLYEKRAPVFYCRPKEYEMGMVRERWIRSKYEKKLFMIPGADVAAAAAAAASAAASTASTAASSAAASTVATPASSSIDTKDTTTAAATAVAAAAAASSALPEGSTTLITSTSTTEGEDPQIASSASASPATAASSSSTRISSLSGASQSYRASSASCSSSSSPSTLSPNDPAIFQVPSRTTEGYLFKSNKSHKWQRRWFQLWGRELHYYKDSNESYEKGRIDVVHCKIVIPESSGSTNASTNTAPISHRYLFELVSTEQNRSYPFAAETEDEMFHWIHAIRRTILFYTKIVTQNSTEQQGMLAKTADLRIPYAKLTVVKRGTLQKQGGGWMSTNKRYFICTESCLYYYKSQPGDADLPEGGICLESADIGPGEERMKKKFAFTIMSPDRTYFIQAASQAEMEEWKTKLIQLTDTLQKRRTVDFADKALRE